MLYTQHSILDIHKLKEEKEKMRLEEKEIVIGQHTLIANGINEESLPLLFVELKTTEEQEKIHELLCNGFNLMLGFDKAQPEQIIKLDCIVTDH